MDRRTLLPNLRKDSPFYPSELQAQPGREAPSLTGLRPACLAFVPSPSGLYHVGTQPSLPAEGGQWQPMHPHAVRSTLATPIAPMTTVISVQPVHLGPHTVQDIVCQGLHSRSNGRDNSGRRSACAHAHEGGTIQRDGAPPVQRCSTIADARSDLFPRACCAPSSNDLGLLQPSNELCGHPHQPLPPPALSSSPTRGHSITRATDNGVPIGVPVLPMQRRRNRRSTIPYAPTRVPAYMPTNSRSRGRAAHPGNGSGTTLQLHTTIATGTTGYVAGSSSAVGTKTLTQNATPS